MGRFDLPIGAGSRSCSLVLLPETPRRPLGVTLGTTHPIRVSRWCEVDVLWEGSGCTERAGCRDQPGHPLGPAEGMEGERA